MRVFILSYGTRGDVVPCLALAAALREAGHQPLVAAPAVHAALAAEYEVPFAPLDGGLSVLWDSQRTWEAVSSGERGVPAWRAAWSALRPPDLPALPDVLAQVWEAARGSDVVVHFNALLAWASRYLAERLDVPLVVGQAYPLFEPTGEFPVPLYDFTSGPRLPPWVNRASYRGMLRVLRGLTRRGVDAWATGTLGLPNRRRRLLEWPDRRVPVLTAMSTAMLPRPGDWPASAELTGCWLMPPTRWQPPPALEAFLADGEPPVYVGFGSMQGADTAAVGRVIVQAVRLAGVRAVLSTGDGGLDAADEPGVHVIRQAPHDWLFPRMSSVVHHGGVYTMVAALLAGRPQAVCPHTADQPFWAARLHDMGLAPGRLRLPLDAAELAAAIRATVEDPSMAARAAAVAATLRAEGNRARRAVQVIEEARLSWRGAPARHR